MSSSIEALYRYKAFISYSHRDSKFAKYLHKKLENYSFSGSGFKGNTKPLFPIFLDESELKAGLTLSDAIQDAIKSSEYLIVICSKNSMLSKWVKAELSFMRELGRDLKIIGVIPDQDGDEAHLLELFGQDSEHLAADFRAGKNKYLQLSKIAATVTGVELDELYQRESRRKNKQMISLGVGLSAIATLMSGLAAQAYLSKTEAVRQRQQSEEVIAFMIDEFRDDLEKLDKLDLLSNVSEKAQDYFDDRELSLLSDNSLLLQSRTLRQLSDVDEKRGDITLSRQRIESAHMASQLMIQRRPENKDAINEHAENTQYWGYLEYQLGDLSKAKDLSLAAVKSYDLGLIHFPNDPDMAWKRAIAEQNVGIMILQSGQAAQARPYFERTLRAVEEQYRSRTLKEEELYEYTGAYSWYIRSLPDDTTLSFLYETHQKQLMLFQEMQASGARSILNQAEKLNIERAVVKLLLNTGKDTEAKDLMLSIQNEFETLLEYDFENVGWRRHLMRSKLTMARLHNKNGLINERNRELQEVLKLWEKSDGEKWGLTTDIVLGIDCLNARRLYDEVSLAAALKDLARAEKAIKDYRKDKIRPRDKYNIATLNSLKAELLAKQGRMDEAQSTQRYVLSLLSGKDSYTMAEQKLQLLAYTDLKLTDEERTLRDKLETRGFVFN